MNSIITYIPLLLQGVEITILAWFFAGTLSLCFGTLLGILSCRYLEQSILSGIIRSYTFVAKGIPAYVQILIAYFVLPALTGINIPAFFAATLALAFCSAGYITEIVRSGINTIPRGQWDACFALGYPIIQTLRRIIMPQVVRNIAPTLCGELEQLLKSTSLLATIGVTELTRAGMNIISRELNPLPVYCTIAALYLILSACLQGITWYAERKMQYGNR